MPAPAKPRQKPPLPPNLVQVAGNQEQFQTAGFALAAELGWKGEPTDETNDINVEDAQNFLVKTMHEFFQAGALGQELPDHLPVCAHLGIDDSKELAAVTTALKAQHEAGKQATVTTVEKRVVPVGAKLILPLSGTTPAGKAV